MIKVIDNGWYGEALPGGKFAVSKLNSILTHSGEFPCPSDWLLFTRCFDLGETFLVAGQSHTGTDNLIAQNGSWHVLGPSYGVSPIAFDLAGNPVQNTVGFGSQGIRWIDELGVHTGDQTYAHPTIPGLYEFTAHGDVTVGQGGEGGATLISPEGRFQLWPGDCRFIRFNRAGNALAISIVVPGQCVLIWLDRSEVPGLKPDTFGVPVKPQEPPPPPPPPPVQEPKPMPKYTGNPTEVLRALRATFPVPLGPRHAEFLIRACAVVGNKAGLSKKESGTNITLPSGQKVSQDWMVFPDGFGIDFLDDGEGAGNVRWGQLVEHDPARWYDPSNERIDGEAPKPPVPAPVLPPPPVKYDDSELRSLIATLAEKVDKLEGKLAEVSNAPEAEYEVRIGRSYGHSHSASIRRIK